MMLLRTSTDHYITPANVPSPRKKTPSRSIPYALLTRLRRAGPSCRNETKDAIVIKERGACNDVSKPQDKTVVAEAYILDFSEIERTKFTGTPHRFRPEVD